MTFSQIPEFPNTKPILLLTPKGRVLFANESAIKTLTLKRGESITGLSSEPNLFDFYSNFKKSNFTSISNNFILFDIKESLGNVFPFTIDFNKLVIADKELYLLVFNSDNEKIQVEDRLNTLHNALEYGEVSVLISDEMGKVKYASGSFEKILKSDISKLFDKEIHQLFLNLLTVQDIENLKLAVQTKAEWKKLVSDISESGNVWFKELKLTPIKNSDFAPSRFIMTATDITDYIQKNRIVRQSEQKQKSIINNISDILFIVRDEENHLIFENGNENFYEYFTLKKEAVGEKLLSNVLPSDLFEQVLVSIENYDKVETLTKFHFKDAETGKQFLCKMTATEDPFEKAVLYVLTLTDLTDHILNEKRLQDAFEKENKLNKLKTAFLANMSHEIRTPLNAIIGYADLLEDEAKEGEVESVCEYIHYLKEGVTRLLDLVDNIIEASLLESGEISFEFEKLNVNTFFKNVFPIYQTKKSNLNINVSLKLSDEELFINVDESKLKKVIDLVVDNAFKYNKENGDVYIRTKLEDDFAIIEVEDTGIGFDDSKIEELLEPFTQIEEEGYKRQYEGAGLGLTIAVRLVNAMGGKVEIKSKENIGTIISILFAKQ